MNHELYCWCYFPIELWLEYRICAQCVSHYFFTDVLLDWHRNFGVVKSRILSLFFNRVIHLQNQNESRIQYASDASNYNVLWSHLKNLPRSIKMRTEPTWHHKNKNPNILQWLIYCSHFISPTEPLVSIFRFHFNFRTLWIKSYPIRSS